MFCFRSNCTKLFRLHFDSVCLNVVPTVHNCARSRIEPTHGSRDSTTLVVAETRHVVCGCCCPAPWLPVAVTMCVVSLTTWLC